MATRDDLMPLKKQFLVQSVSGKNQYSNINLNQSQKLVNASFFQSNSKSISNSKGFEFLGGDLSKLSIISQVNEGTAATLKIDSKIVDDEKRLWNKSSSNNLHSKPFKSFTAFDEAEENVQTKSWKNDSSKCSPTTSSTLSLHIAAYENFIEGGDNVTSDKKEGLKKDLIVGKKKITINLALNPFEFPRQQKEDESDPAIMQFKASQQLLNPNQLGSSNDNQQRTQNVEGVRRDIMANIISSPEDFADPLFWQKLYKSGKKIDWYGNIQKYIPTIRHMVKKEQKILQIGCGNALSEYGLYDDGYHYIHSIDIDEKLISERSKDNETLIRPGLTFACEDATKLSDADNTYDFIFDKGTLDALLPSEKVETEVATKMLDEALRVLKPNSKYIIISLVQRHIVEFVTSYYSNRDDIFLYFHALEVPDEDHNLIPAAIIQFHKLKQPMPAGLPKVIKFVTDPIKHVSVNLTAAEMSEQFEEYRNMALFTNQCRRPLKQITRLTLHDSAAKIPRWTFHVCDQSPRPVKWAFLIVPAGQFNLDDETVTNCASQTQYDRVILAEQQIDCDYTNQDKVMEELEAVSVRFRPLYGEARAEIAWCYGNDETHETKVDSGEAANLGAYSVYNLNANLADNNRVIRRLVFDSSPEIVQTDVLVYPSKKNDKLCKKVDVLHLSGLYQIMMLASMEFRPGGLTESLKKNYNFAVLGVAGGTLVSFLHAVYKQSKITAVEIVPELYDVARKWFGYPNDDDRLTSVGRDALEWVKDDNAGTYDFIFVDVSGSKDGVATCPGPEFVDPEFIPLYKKRLNKHGIIAFNVVSTDNKFIDQITTTFLAQFKYVSVGRPGDPTNDILIASDTQFSRPRDYNVARRSALASELSDIYEMVAYYKPCVEKKATDENDFLPSHLLNQNGKKKNNKKR